MKILHLSDLHIGRGINQTSLIEDQEYVLKECEELIKKQGIKYVLIAGDLYDKPIPSVEATKVLSEFFRVLIQELKCQVYCINGNHDSSDRLNFGASLLKYSGLYIDSVIGDDFKIPHYELVEDNVKVNLYSLPFFSPSLVRIRMGKENVKTYEDAVKELLNVNPVNKDEINIIQAHFLVLNGNSEAILSDSEMPISVGGIDKISYHVFDSYDYCALGHLHNPQHIGREVVRYGGSLLKYSDNEVNQKKCFTVIDIKGKDDITVEKIDIIPKRDLLEVKDTFDNIINNVNRLNRDNLYSIILLDETPVINAAARIRNVLPNLIKLDYKNHIETRDTNKIISSSFMSKSIEEQFKEFYKATIGREMNEQEEKYFLELTKKEEE